MTDKEIYEILQRADEANNIINALHTERLDYHSEYIPLIESNQDILSLADEIERLQSENTRLKAERDKAVEDFYEYVQGGKEICAFCLHDYECEPGETICGATYKGFKWRGLNERGE